MITPEEIRKKANRRWHQGQILRAWLGVETVFPLVLPAGKPSAWLLLNHFSDVQEWKATLEADSHSQKGAAYRLDYADVNHRQLGRQRLPKAVVFETIDDLVAYIGKHAELKRFAQLQQSIQQHYPALLEWLAHVPVRALQQAKHWPQLRAVLDYFIAHPRPQLYLRELDIPAVDSKFIEQHKGLLRDFLDIVLSDDDIDTEVTGLTNFGFERRFGLKYDQPLIRFRWLDPMLAEPTGGLTDLSIPLSQFCTLKPNCQRIFITENKINGLSFPPQSQSMVIFGLGYGISALKTVDWLAKKELIYWGDLDTHGFSILSQLRGYFPQVRSLLMDQSTLQNFRSLWVSEVANKRYMGELPHLSDAEAQLYDSLRHDYFGERVRLEQERISFDWLQTALSGWVC